MGGRIKEARIHDHATRIRLPVRHHPYWRLLTEGRHLGYYRGRGSSKWVARYRESGTIGGYQSKTLGCADDLVPADGVRILSWKQAMDAALQWFNQLEHGTAPSQEITIASAVGAYVEKRDKRYSARAGRKLRSDAHRLLKYIALDPQFMKAPLHELTERQIKRWYDKIDTLTGAGKQRLLNDMRAALNDCFMLHRKSLPSDLPLTIKYGLKLSLEDLGDEREINRSNQILSDEQVRAIIATARALDPDGDFFLLVLLMAATGARFSQIQRMKVGDVEPEGSRLIIPSSRKGKRISSSLIKMRVGSDVIDALRPCIKGRSGSEPLLLKWRRKQVTKWTWVRVGRGPWLSAAEMTRPWRQVVGALNQPGIVPYALRHSSIVRGIRSGLPIRLVAALHDTSVVMIERHYSRWITEGLEEFAAQAIIPLAAE